MRLEPRRWLLCYRSNMQYRPPPEVQTPRINRPKPNVVRHPASRHSQATGKWSHGHDVVGLRDEAIMSTTGSHPEC